MGAQDQSDREKYEDMCVRLDTVPALDGQTDRIAKKYRALHALHADAR